MKKALLMISAAALLCFAALWGYVQSDAFAARLRPYIVRPLQDILGPAARIGKVKATLLPLVLEVRDIAVPSERTAESLAVRKVRVYINPLPLLWKSVFISSTTVLEPRIEGTRGPDGTIDAVAMIDAIRGNIERRKGTAPATVTVAIRTVTVRNGKVVLRDVSSGARVSISGLNARSIFRKAASAGIARISSGSLSISVPGYPVFDAALHATVAFDENTVSLSLAELRSRNVRVAASGTVAAKRDGPVDLKVEAHLAKGWLGAVAGILGRKNLKAEVVTAASIGGTIGSPRLEGTAVLTNVPAKGFVVGSARIGYFYADSVLTIKGTDWILERSGRTLSVASVALAAEYAAGTVRVIRASLSSTGAEFHASGSISGVRGYDLVLSIRSEGTGELTRFLFGMAAPGSISLSGSVSGPIREPVFAGALSAGPVTIRDVAVQGLNGMLRFSKRTFSLTGVTIRQDDSRYLLDGSIDFGKEEPYFDARLRIIRSDVVNVVRLFYRKLPLDLSASGEFHFSGTRKDYRGRGHLDLDAGAAYGESFEKGVLDVELNANRIDFPLLLLEKGGGHVSGKGWIAFNGSYSATIASKGVNLASIDHLRVFSMGGPFTMEADSSGSFSEPWVTARAEIPALAVRGIGIGHAVCDLSIRSAELSLSASLDGVQEHSGRLTATLGLSRPYRWKASSDLRIVDEDPSVWFPGSDMLSRIRLSAEARSSLYGELGSPGSISGSIVLPRMSVLIADHRIGNDGDVVVHVRRGTFSVRSLVLAGTGTRLAISGNARPSKDVDLALDGDVNLSLLRMLYREVEHGDGTASLHLAVRDDWNRPSVDGRVTIKDGMLKVQDVPQKFSGLQGTILFDRERITTEGLTADVGGGRVTVIGSAQLKDTALLDFSLRTIVDGVTVHYPPGLTARLGGTLYYDGNRDTQTLSGDIDIQEARYEKRIEWKSMLVDFTRGITRRKKTDIGWIGETRLNIRFTGSENVLFESNLARIPLKIDLLFKGTVNEMHLLGRVEAREGKLYFRNNVFKILYASADFVDPNRINPVLDVQTETRVRDYRIRLAVSGNADRAVVTLLSDPPLADSDILALLALGRTGEELRGQEEKIGKSESLSVATGKFQDLLESRARSLTGLDRFQIDPYINKSDTAVPRVTVGKEVVQNRLFMTYSSNIGGTTPEQDFRIEYILNRNISLLGEYDELGQIGADLKFRFEFR